MVFALSQSWSALPSSTIKWSWKKLWPDIITNPSNDPQISVTLEVIEQVSTETQISPEDLEVWCRGMDKEENGTSYNELLLLRRLRDKALISRYNNLKQKKID